MSWGNRLVTSLPENEGYGPRLRDIERRLDELALSPRLQNASIGAGGLQVLGDGSIRFVADDGMVVLEIDKAALTYDRANGTRQLEVTPAGGLKFYKANGTTVITTLDGAGLRVGPDVEIDADGLQVIGGFVTPIWPATEGGNADNVSLTTSQTDFVTVTFDPPSWVETLVLLSVARLKIGNVSGAEYNATVGITNDDGGAHENRTWSQQTVPDDTTQSIVMSNREEIALSPAGRQVDVVVDAFLSSGSNSSNNVSLSIVGFGLRSP